MHSRPLGSSFSPLFFFLYLLPCYLKIPRADFTSLYPKSLPNLTTHFKLPYDLLPLTALQVLPVEYIQERIFHLPCLTPTVPPWMLTSTTYHYFSVPWVLNCFPSSLAPISYQQRGQPDQAPHVIHPIPTIFQQLPICLLLDLLNL